MTLGRYGKKFSLELGEQIGELLAEAEPPMHRCTAAALAGVTPGTLNGWIRRGESELEAHERDIEEHPERDVCLTPHAVFYMIVSEAEARALRAVSESLWRAEDGFDDEGNQTSSAKPTIDRCKWWLERRYPKLFGKASQVVVTGSDGGPIQMESVSPYDALLKALGHKNTKAVDDEQSPPDDS